MDIEQAMGFCFPPPDDDGERQEEVLAERLLASAEADVAPLHDIREMSRSYGFGAAQTDAFRQIASDIGAESVALVESLAAGRRVLGGHAVVRRVLAALTVTAVAAAVALLTSAIVG